MKGGIKLLALFTEALDAEFFKDREKLIEYQLYSFFISVKIDTGILCRSLKIIDDRKNLIDYMRL